MFFQTTYGYLFLIGIFLLPVLNCGAQEIDVWYGTDQKFGSIGQPQRWINILGSIGKPSEGTKLLYLLNDASGKELTLGSDLHRLANPGDFNIELGWNEVDQGMNRLIIIKESVSGHGDSIAVSIQVEKGNKWPLPYEVDFSKLGDLQSVVQIVDGKWQLTPLGVRTAEPFYDRVLSLGDNSWYDYEAHIELTIHGWTPSEPGAPTYNVTHFGTALRWRGHHSDRRQPSRKWYPLGAQGEFLLKNAQDSCQWRILFDGGKMKPQKYGLPTKGVAIEKRMHIRATVQTLSDGHTQYRFRQWLSGKIEPSEWDVIGLEEGDYPSGALCLVPHNSDVTIHRVAVRSIKK